MKRAEKARFFDVSLTTLQNWKRQGCPLSGDLGAIAEWRTRRKLSQEGLDALIPGLPGLVGEFTRRLIDVDKRIEAANKWPGDQAAAPGTIKAAVLVALLLERMLLQLPGRLLAEAQPASLPQDIHEIVLKALDEAREVQQ